MLRNKKVVVLSVLLALSLGVVGFFIWNKSNSKETFPKEIRSQITGFQPYFFQEKYNLPEDFKVVKESIKYEKGTLLFSLNSPTGKTITLSQQSVPSEFSGQGGSLVGKETFDSPLGTITLSFLEGRTTAFLITKDRDAFIILNSNQAISSDDIRVILSSLIKT